ncbi:MAG: M42 family metallopeptidase [Firmicutes bacterium]|nr:M42 family metallopeptidase [Bacillota bacterium]
MKTTGLAGFLKDAISAPGVSGYEEKVVAAVKEEMSGLYDEARTDALGNLIMLKRGIGRAPHPRIMLAAHIDEIGLMVTKIEDQGCLRVTQVGGIDKRILPGLEVIVYGKKELPGVVGAKPPHVQDPDEQKKAVKWEDLYVDIGLTGEEAQELVNIGDIITFAQSPIQLQGRFMAGKSMDNRTGVMVLFECLKFLRAMRHHADVYCVATVQEEVGLRGATTVTYGIVPDIGIAIDVGFGEQPSVPEHQGMSMDKGPGIAIGPVVHPKIFGRLKAIAKELEITVQTVPSPNPYGTDACSIQITRGGIPTALVSIPLRYMHTSVETVCLADIERAGRLLAEFIVRLDKKFVEELKCF